MDISGNVNNEVINKYHNSKVYKIIDNTTNKSYIGSTCEDRLCKRLAQHQAHYKRWQKGEANKVSVFDLFVNNNFSIVLLEQIKCENKDELLKKERHYIETIENIVNKNKPNRNMKEYYQDNKEKIISSVKQRRNQNKEYYKQYQKEYREKKKQQTNITVQF